MPFLSSLFSYLIGKLLDLLPAWLGRRFMPPARVASQVPLDLRRNNPITIAFGTEIPSIDLYFRVANFSPIPLVLDRLLLEVWIGQPTLHGAILRRYELGAGTSREDIRYWDNLTLPQQAQIRQGVADGLLRMPVSVDVTGYFDSKLGPIEVRVHLEQQGVPCRPPLPRASPAGEDCRRRADRCRRRPDAAR